MVTSAKSHASTRKPMAGQDTRWPPRWGQEEGGDMDPHRSHAGAQHGRPRIGRAWRRARRLDPGLEGAPARWGLHWGRGRGTPGPQKASHLGWGDIPSTSHTFSSPGPPVQAAGTLRLCLLCSYLAELGASQHSLGDVGSDLWWPGASPSQVLTRPTTGRQPEHLRNLSPRLAFP